jgi:hypothetical protein
VERRLDANYSPKASRVATAEVSRALSGMEGVARRLGVPFVLVVFPDRILVDADLRRLLGRDLVAEGYDLERLRRWTLESVQGPPVLDASEVLSGGSEYYRSADTHLSDLGTWWQGSGRGGWRSCSSPSDAGSRAGRWNAGSPTGSGSRSSDRLNIFALVLLVYLTCRYLFGDEGRSDRIEIRRAAPSCRSTS